MKYKTEPNSFHPIPNLTELDPYDGFLGLCKSPHTRHNYHQDLRVLKLFLDQSGVSQPTQAQPIDLSRFVGQLAKPGQTPNGKPRPAYSTRSMKRILAATRSFYRYLASVQKIATDPTAVFHNMAIRSPQRNPRPLTARDRKAIVENLRQTSLVEFKISLVVLLGYHCGLRVSEMAKLKARDLDMDQGWLTVIGKGDKERILPMTPSLKNLLAAYLSRKEESPYLFPSPRSKAIPSHIRYLEDWVKEAARWGGLEHPGELTVHVLRHSFGTQLAESGASAYEIRDLMGHSSITVSENYVKLASTKSREAHQKAFGNALVLPSDFGRLLSRFRKFQLSRN
ncbi:MAG: tyrosine-type recombinase/integrase [bacterium]